MSRLDYDAINEVYARTLLARATYHREQNGLRLCRRCGNEVPIFQNCPCPKDTP